MHPETNGPSATHPPTPPPPFIRSADVRRLIDMRETIEVMRETFRLLGGPDPSVVMPARGVMSAGPDGAALLLMPARLDALNAMGVKLLTFYPANPTRGWPAIQGLLVVYDPETGAVRCLIEADHVTALRTGATSGLATDLLARPDADTLTLIGAGVQGEQQIAACRAVRDIRRIRLVDQRPERAERLAERLRAGSGATPQIELDPEATRAVRDSAIVITATTAERPLFPGDALAPGTHVNAIGTYQPHARELDEALLARATLVVDDRAACLETAGELVIPIRAGRLSPAAIAAELGALVTSVHPGRRTDDEVTVFKSVGLAAQDVSLGDRIWRRWRERDAAG